MVDLSEIHCESPQRGHGWEGQGASPPDSSEGPMLLQTARGQRLPEGTGRRKIPEKEAGRF